MPRQGRINIEGGIYHVIQRGIQRCEIFKDDADRQEFIRRLAEGLKETGHKCYGWVLMPNHFHLLIRTGIKSLSDLMRKLLTGYAIYFNRKYKRSGYLYQNRYKSILCQEESYLLELVRYIHLNPLRSNIVKSMMDLNSYKWCGHSVLLGNKKADWQTTGEILERFTDKSSTAKKRYLAFVEDVKDIGERKELSGGGLVRSAGGWKELVNLRNSDERHQGDERILGDGTFVEEVLRNSEERMVKRERMKREGWNFDKLLKHSCLLMGINEDGCIKGKRKGNKIFKAKSLAAYWGINELGINGAEIGRYFGVTRQAAVYLAKRGEELANENNFYLSI